MGGKGHSVPSAWHGKCLDSGSMQPISDTPPGQIMSPGLGCSDRGKPLFWFWSIPKTKPNWFRETH